MDIEYLTDKDGELKAVVIPIELWRELILEKHIPKEELIEELEDYWLNRAMDEAKDTPLLTREEALSFMEE